MVRNDTGLHENDPMDDSSLPSSPVQDRVKLYSLGEAEREEQQRYSCRGNGSIMIPCLFSSNLAWACFHFYSLSSSRYACAMRETRR